MAIKSIPIEYYQAEFDGLRTNLLADTALARYMASLQGDDKKEANDWAQLLRGRQEEALWLYSKRHPL